MSARRIGRRFVCFDCRTSLDDDIWFIDDDPEPSRMYARYCAGCADKRHNMLIDFKENHHADA